MPRIITQLLALFLLCLFHPDNAGAQQGGQPLNLNPGDAVVTGFSGTLPPAPGKPHPRNKSAIDFTFINPDGPSVRVIDLSRPGYVWDGRLFAAPKTFDVFAKDVGQVFGVALDDSAQPNIYVAATSVFGLNIVVRGRDGLPERRKKGAPGAGWMKGQFGLDLQGGPGSIYKIDGRTGVPALFANVTLNGVSNPGPGLGNLAYDSEHKQLFVSDLHTGMIHRFALDGKELGAFDHGVAGLGAAKLAAVPFNPANRPNIASERFDSEKPDSWGFAPVARRVWGLAVHEGRLYYSVVSGPQIWSVGIERDGSFAADPHWEFEVPAQAGPLPISDIAFSQKGAMILAQRALIAGAYDYSAFTRPGEPQVLRVWLKGPNDPPSPGRWKLVPEEYAVGFAGNFRNTNGGVALGYGYGQDGTLSPQGCEAALWTTGQNLRNNPAMRSQLEPGGPLLVHGLQGSPIDMVRGANEPPATSYFIDYDDKFDDPSASGHMGSVRIYTTPCAAPAASAAPVPAVIPIATPIGCIGPNCRNACTPTCICPPGTVLEGKECVKRECPPPQVFDPATGACKCPPGTALEDGKCVPVHTLMPPHECRPPLVLDPITGLCVPPKHECVPPLVLDPVTGACVCPPGSVMQDGKCVPQICPPPLVPGPCECPEGTVQDGGLCVKVGTLIVKKTVTSRTEIPLPANTLFPMTVTCGLPTMTWSFSLTANGSYTINNIPFGMTCSVVETLPPLPANLCRKPLVPVWFPLPTYTPPSVVISGTVATIMVHNSVTCVEKPDGRLTVTKKVSPDPRGIGNTLTFPIVVTCTSPSATYPLNVNGNTSTLPFNLPVGSICSFTETQPALPPGCTWLAPIFSPANVPIASGLNMETVTNGYRCSDCPSPQVPNVDGICACPASMVPGAVPGTCICPQGQVLVGGACVPTPPICPPPQVPNVDGICACPAPMQPGAVPGTCICPNGQVPVGGACVTPPPTCAPPQVPNVDGICACPAPMLPGAVPGQCICPQGQVLTNGKCVTPRKQPVKEKRRERACPEGMIKQGSKCVKRNSNEPRVTPRGVINGIGIIRGLGGGGGGGAGPTGGGGTPGKR